MEEQDQTRSGSSMAGKVIKFVFMALIILVLSAISHVAYQIIIRVVYQERRTEAKENLHSLATAQFEYFKTHGTYAGGADCFKELGWRPEGKTRYRYICDADTIPCSRRLCQKGKDCFKAWGGDTPPRAVSSRHAFTVMAVGNADGDSCEDVWIISDDDNPSNWFDDIGG